MPRRAASEHFEPCPPQRTVLAALLADRGVEPRVDRLPAEAAAARLRDLIERSGARAAAVDLAAEHVFAARDALGEVPPALEGALGRMLTDLTDGCSRT